MSNNFYSNEMMVKIRVEQRMAEAEAYRRATQVEQNIKNEHITSRAVFRPFGWLRRLIVRMNGAGA
jgi:hypothetical protein